MFSVTKNGKEFAFAAEFSKGLTDILSLQVVLRIL